jgi:hypothetical protein
VKAKCYDKSFKYTPVQEQGKDYLQKKFDKLRHQKPVEVRVASVTALPKIARAK